MIMKTIEPLILTFELTRLPDGKRAFFIDRDLWDTTDVNGLMMVYERDQLKPREHPLSDGLMEMTERI
jgi:hypothetical protein